MKGYLYCFTDRSCFHVKCLHKYTYFDFIVAFRNHFSQVFLIFLICLEKISLHSMHSYQPNVVFILWLKDYWFLVLLLLLKQYTLTKILHIALHVVLSLYSPFDYFLTPVFSWAPDPCVLTVVSFLSSYFLEATEE